LRGGYFRGKVIFAVLCVGGRGIAGGRLKPMGERKRKRQKERGKDSKKTERTFN